MINFLDNIPNQKPFNPESRNTYKTNAMSENIRQRRLNSSPEYFDTLYYHHF